MSIMTPWQGAGTALPPGLTAEQAMKAAGLDWEVETADIWTKDQKRTDVERYRVTRRMTDNCILGIVPKGYKVIQNRQAFGLFDRVISQGRMADFSGAGEFNNGSKVFIVSRLPGVMEIGKGIGPIDEVERYLLLANPHDGSVGQMVFTPIRVVCQNTLALALSVDESADNVTRLAPTATIRHTGDVNKQMKVAEKVMGSALKYYEKFGDFAGHLYRRQLGGSQVVEIIDEVFPANKFKEVTPKIAAARSAVEDLFVTGHGHEKIPGSAWALLNAFAQFADHGYAMKRDSDGALDGPARTKSIMMGGAKTIKNKATKVIFEAVR